MLTLPSLSGLGHPVQYASKDSDAATGHFGSFPHVQGSAFAGLEASSPNRELGGTTATKLDEAQIAGKLDDSLHSGESDSDNDSEHEEVALKVSFYVKDTCFHFKDSSKLKEKGYVLEDTTLFFPIGISNRSVDNKDAWNLENIPVELVKKILSSPEKTVQIDWQDSTVQLHFVKGGSMDESSLLARIRDVCNGKGVTGREIKTEADLRFFENRTYLPTQ